MFKSASNYAWSSEYGNKTLLSGYEKEITGETIYYHSPLPDAGSALLVRSIEKDRYIEWETATAPDDSEGKYLTYVLLAGIDVNPDSHRFDIFINGEKIFSFSNPISDKNRYWKIPGKYGSELLYRITMTDIHDDHMGFMFLRWPVLKTFPGKPLRIRVAGESAESKTWFMVFKYPVRQTISLLNEPVLLRKTEKQCQSVRVEAVRLEEPVKTVFHVEGQDIEWDLDFGFNILRLPVPIVNKEKDILIGITIDDQNIPDARIRLKPIEHKDIYLLHHSHVDIGYTHIQEDVKCAQWNNLKKAAQLARKTRDYPPESRFKWNSEVLWHVASYLKTGDKDRNEQFIQSVMDGQIGLDGLYANELTGLCRPEELFHLLDDAREISQKYHITIDTAMITDVPGYTWGLVPALAQNRIKYLSIGPNYGHRIGHFLKEWADRPFYWESPSGKERVLCWVHGKGYSWFHTGLNYSSLKKRLNDEAIFDYLSQLEQNNYPYDIVSFRYSIGSDNGPPDTQIADVVKEWNETYASPRMIIATTTELFKVFENKYGSRLPVYKGDLTGYWEDGAASSARETAMNRNSSERLVQAEFLWSILRPESFPAEEFAKAWNRVLLYNEHTWGSWNSISDPHSDFTKHQWEVKKSFAEEADQLSKTLLKKAIEPLSETNKAVTHLNIFNTNSWNRTDIVYIPKKLSLAGDQVKDDQGMELQSQRLSTGELAVLVRDIPSLGFRQLHFSKGSPFQSGELRLTNNILSNDHISLEIDKNSGTISKLLLNGLPHNLVDFSQGEGLNGYIYVKGRNPVKQLRNSRVVISLKEKGPLVASYKIESRAPGCRSLSSEIRLVNGLQRIDIITDMNKRDVYEQEGVHFVWPFSVPDGQIRLDNAWGHYLPEYEQLPGSNKNYFSFQRWIDISNQKYGITWTSPDAPLVEIGSITSDPIVVGWIKNISFSNTFFSYVMNNYWETNYKASQGGPVTFRYSLRPHTGMFDPMISYRFGIEQSQPLIIGSADAGKPTGRSFFKIQPSCVVITSMKPSTDGKALMIRIFNVGDHSEEVIIDWGDNKPGMVFLSNPFEERSCPFPKKLTISPREIKTLRAEGLSE